MYDDESEVTFRQELSGISCSFTVNGSCIIVGVEFANPWMNRCGVLTGADWRNCLDET